MWSDPRGARAEAARTVAEASAARPRHPLRTKPADEPCLLCGGPQIARHCKLVCRDCGAMRDCSDP